MEKLARVQYLSEKDPKFVVGLGPWVRASQYMLILKEKEDNSVCPSNFTFVAATKACAQLKFMDDGRSIHLQIVKQGLESDAFVRSTVVDMYAKCRSLVEAKKTFDLMPC